MNLADKLGFGPKRSIMYVSDGFWDLIVTPPQSTGFSASTIRLSAEQFQRYQQWLKGDILIQDAFPELSKDQREIIMTGISPEEFHEAFKEEEE